CERARMRETGRGGVRGVGGPAERGFGGGDGRPGRNVPGGREGDGAVVGPRHEGGAVPGHVGEEDLRAGGDRLQRDEFEAVRSVGIVVDDRDAAGGQSSHVTSSHWSDVSPSATLDFSRLLVVLPGTVRRADRLLTST